MRQILLIFGLVLSSTLWAQETVLKGMDNPNETSIAVNPKDPQQIVAAANVNNFYFSGNGGEDWTRIKATSALGVYGDPVLHYHNDILFYTHLSKTSGKVWGEWFDRIVVQQIHSLSPWSETSYSVGYNQGKMQDKPWVSSDTIPNSAYTDRLYVSWTEFDKYGSADPAHFSRIRFAYLQLGKDAFSEAITISDTTGDCIDSDNTLEGAVTAVGPNGQLYAVWAGHDKIYFDRSMDGGEHWGKDLVIGEQLGGWDMTVPHLMRANGMPFIQVGTNGTIYVCWADSSNGGSIWLTYSNDEGKHWQKAQRISQDWDHKPKYFPNMSYNKVQDQVEIVYHDHNGSSTNMLFNVIMTSVAIKEDGSLALKQTAVSPYALPLPGNRFFFGDYLDVDALNNSKYVAYTRYTGAHTEVVISRFDDYPEDREQQPRIYVVVDRDSAYVIRSSVGPGHLQGEVTLRSGDHSMNVSFDHKYSGKKQELRGWEPEDELIEHFQLDPKAFYIIDLDYYVKGRCFWQKKRIRYSIGPR